MIGELEEFVSRLLVLDIWRELNMKPILYILDDNGKYYLCSRSKGGGADILSKEFCKENYTLDFSEQGNYREEYYSDFDPDEIDYDFGLTQG